MRVRIAGALAGLQCLFGLPAPGNSQEPERVPESVESVVFSGGVGYWDTDGLDLTLARLAISYEYLKSSGLGFYGEAGVGLRSAAATWVLVPGVVLRLTPRERSSAFLLGGLSFLGGSGSTWGANVGAGYDMNALGDGLRFEGRIHILGVGGAIAQSYLLEALVAYSFKG